MVNSQDVNVGASSVETVSCTKSTVDINSKIESETDSTSQCPASICLRNESGVEQPIAKVNSSVEKSQQKKRKARDEASGEYSEKEEVDSFLQPPVNTCSKNESGSIIEVRLSTKRKEDEKWKHDASGSNLDLDLAVAEGKRQDFKPVPEVAVSNLEILKECKFDNNRADTLSVETVELNTCRRKSADQLENSLKQFEMAGTRQFSDDAQIPGLLENEIKKIGVGGQVLSVDTVKVENVPRMLQSSSHSNYPCSTKKKLLIIDLNGLLVDFVQSDSFFSEADIIVSGKAVFKRPFCDEFLQFCFERFNVGVWSSRLKKNVDRVVNFLMGDDRDKLLFCWDQSHCTATRFTTVEHSDKPLLLKELKKLWEMVVPKLPWEKGDYNESNTLLLDDSPYKALRNPAHTAIFPNPYDFRNAKDCSLGPGGDIRVYLEGLAGAGNVQTYVQQNPFGQEPITESNPSWGFYCKVINAEPY